LIAIVDYGIGNLRSVQNKFKKISIVSLISADPEIIKKANKLILPGIGNFKYGMEQLKRLDLIEILNEKVLVNKIPILGICLGTQLFAKYSVEGNCEGLGWIDAEVVRFNVSDKVKYKVPHMGWNSVLIKKHNSLNSTIFNENQFYFVHSYHLKCRNESDIWMTTTYDYEFVSAVQRNNIYGVQFHPEKSHEVGFELIKKFAEL